MIVDREVIDIVALDSKGRGVGRSLAYLAHTELEAPRNKEPECEDQSHLQDNAKAQTIEQTEPPLGKVVFVEGALLGERIAYRPRKIKRKYIEGQLLDILQSSSQRVQPLCPYFSKCGGCVLQHIDGRAQVSIKQRQLENNLQHIGKVRAEHILRPITGHDWGYRYRARFSVRYAAGRDTVLIGFHQKESNYIVDIDSCAILPPIVAGLLPDLHKLINSLSIRERLPTIELALGDTVLAFSLRILDPLNDDDKEKLRTFADQYHVQFWLQPHGPDSVFCFYPKQGELNYSLPELGLSLSFRPNDFTQVNPAMNQALIAQALRLLQVEADERILDLFCGLGNFTLPLARYAREVVGIEGSEALCLRARENAKLNQLSANTQFLSQNLFEIDDQHIIRWGRFDRWLIDPPRDGALTLMRALVQVKESHADFLPKRIVYVSCDPATLARDAGILVKQVGYRLNAAGIINMFPHTSHIESMAVFDWVDEFVSTING